MPKKIKVIDVVNNNDDNINETVVEHAKIEEETEAVVVVVKPVHTELQEKVEDKQDYKSIRTQQFVECSKCHQMMTATSLKYYHKKHVLRRKKSKR